MKLDDDFLNFNGTHERHIAAQRNLHQQHPAPFLVNLFFEGSMRTHWKRSSLAVCFVEEDPEYLRVWSAAEVDSSKVLRKMTHHRPVPALKVMVEIGAYGNTADG